MRRHGPASANGPPPLRSDGPPPLRSDGPLPLRSQERGPSPLAAERLHPWTRCQVTDRLQELGELYAANCGTDEVLGQGRSRAFTGRLLRDIRRPGFGLLVAQGATVTACAYGFPLRSGVFEIRALVVPRRVRELSPHQPWNLARRLQRRLLADHGCTGGLTRVARTDLRTLTALRSWGWRDDEERTYGIPVWTPHCVLLLDL
ncbi:hypothetical protein H9Y04_18815 [Streptomyces sp. TRM66268-LWL]|uniref:GNAT family N-acetyltransferase n=1 Tax=Streptomyces polyasparticus TaxID=2767826 RepID=A0ABR7SJV8_9ACTN|nr:hypothetical protein [Streptomyces polyasparticus]MBC9714613.1 hypothetical protein [Streptomyces polyasparticus]